MKKRMSQGQEFEIMKLVLDKFLWLGFIIMGYGVWKMVDKGAITDGIYHLLTGIAVLIIFLVIIVREYEVMK